MRVALFTDTYRPQVNGVSRTLKRLVDYLEDQGAECKLYVPACTETRSYPDNIRAFSSLPFYLYPECRIALPNVFTMYSELKEFQPDLIHVATPFTIGLMGLHLGQILKIPMVASYHTNFDRYLFYYNMGFFRNAGWQFLRWFHSHFLVTFVPSKTTMQELSSQGFTRLAIWSRGVDCEVFSPDYASDAFRSKYGIERRYVFSFVGRISPEKDIFTLADIAERLPAWLADQLHWIIVGDGPSTQEFKQRMRGSVTFTGYLSGTQLSEVYASSDLFVFPSSTETFGNVVLEALASGTPVIGARAGGVQELILDGQTGRLCRPNDADDFVKAIIAVMEHPAVLDDMSRRAREYALTQSWDAIFARLISQYQVACHHKPDFATERVG